MAFVICPLFPLRILFVNICICFVGTILGAMAYTPYGTIVCIAERMTAALEAVFNGRGLSLSNRCIALAIRVASSFFFCSNAGMLGVEWTTTPKYLKVSTFVMGFGCGSLGLNTCQGSANAVVRIFVLVVFNFWSVKSSHLLRIPTWSFSVVSSPADMRAKSSAYPNAGTSVVPTEIGGDFCVTHRKRVSLKMANGIGERGHPCIL